MTYDPERHHRRSIQLAEYDNASPGVCFVTVCVKDRLCVLGEVVGERTHLSTAGEIVRDCWFSIPEQFPSVAPDAFVVMPNHVHGIIWIVEHGRRGVIHHAQSPGWGVANRAQAPGRSVMNRAPTSDEDASGSGLEEELQGLMNAPGVSLGKIIRAFKARATRSIRKGGFDFAWQRTYWERVLRNEHELHAARRYILDNPLRWHLDRLHPRRQPSLTPRP